MSYRDTWENMRDNCNEALKLLGSMPVAIHESELDPEHAQELLISLSDQLTSLSVHIDACEPEAESGTHRVAAVGGAES